MPLLQEMEDFFKEKEYKYPQTEYYDAIANEFDLKLISIAGTTRIVYKKPRSRSVIKLGYPIHNKAEMAAWELLKDSCYGHLFAPCTGISKDGIVLEQQFIARPIPNCRQDYYWFNDKWNALRKELESNFRFLLMASKESLSDFHEENLRITRNGDVKIIDYSHLLWEYFKNPTTPIEKVVKRVKKIKIPKKNVKMSYIDREIKLVSGSKIRKVNIDQPKQQREVGESPDEW